MIRQTAIFGSCSTPPTQEGNIGTSTGPHSLAAGLVAPRAFADATGRERTENWLAEPGEAGELRALLTEFPAARVLIEAVASHSSHLWDLACADPARLVAVLRSDPAAYVARRIAATAADVAASSSEAETMRLLRRAKADVGLAIALADIAGVWDLIEVTRALTELADMAVESALGFLLRDAAGAGRMTLRDAADPTVGGGLAVLAMGKMGAHELNYSSDIDLMFFFAPDAPLVAGIEAGRFFVRLAQRLIKILQERTERGYVFRVDVRLRPDPASTRVAMSIPAALDYYESSGRNWERAALIKARVCAGDAVAGQTLLAGLAPFVWRKYLDFAALADIHDMKRQVQAFRGHGAVAVEGHNIKLGRGGIREIEFFVQSQQLIAGGRHPQLRRRGTLATLAALAEGGFIDAAVRVELDAAYRFLRTVEHRLQMVADEQTHTLPRTPEELERFARFAGFTGRDRFAEALLAHLNAVEAHYARLFERAPLSRRRDLVFAGEADAKPTLAALSALGFRRPLEAFGMVREWLAGRPRGLKGATAQARFSELLPTLIEEMAKSEDPDAALIVFDRFLGNLSAGGRLFSMLRQTPDLVALVARLLGTAPRLADILAQRPQVLDSLIDPALFSTVPAQGDGGEPGKAREAARGETNTERLSLALKRSLDEASSYEDFLDRVRLFGQEQMFLVGARILSGTVTAQQAGPAFAAIADAILIALHHKVAAMMHAAHGAVPGGESAILAMGKLGGREMAANSDLDLIVVYDHDPARAESDGPRPLPASQYFARLTQRLINAVTTPTNSGRLYEADMRLRPSGRSGPLATSLTAFADYQRNEAWTWEHMALTRARVASASPAFAARIGSVVRCVLGRPREAAALAADVVAMRRRIAAEKSAAGHWDLKYAKGGLIDLEFIGQYIELAHAAATPEILDTAMAGVFERAAAFGFLSAADAETLLRATRLYQDLGQILRLCLAGPFDPKSVGTNLAALLARAADVPDFATLDAYLAETQAQVSDSFARILGEAP
jgi:glutamate-ammonia-ligase adenylyltransferase